MIDSIYLSLDRVQIDPGADLEVVPGRENLRSGQIRECLLYTDKAGGSVCGSKAYYDRGACQDSNRVPFDFCIYPKGKSVKNIIHFSLPKVASGSVNLDPVSRSVAENCLDRVQSGLKDIGVCADLRGGSVSRCDLFVNGVMDLPTDNYFPLLSELPTGKRYLKRDYGTTVLLHNSRREYCFYDKRVQMRRQDRNINLSAYPENVLRAEERFLSSRVCRKEFGVIDFGGLLNYYDHLPGFYASKMRKVLPERCLNVPLLSSEIERIKYYIDRGYGWAYIKKQFGLLYFASRYSSDQFERILKNVFSRFTVRRAMSEFFTAKVEQGLFDDKVVSAVDLYGEIYSKFVLKVA